MTKASDLDVGALFGRSAERLLSKEQLEPNPALVAEGWERRFSADGPRAMEAMHLYAQLGFDVHAEPVTAHELSDDCQDCRLVVALAFQTIYTRKKTSAS